MRPTAAVVYVWSGWSSTLTQTTRSEERKGITLRRPLEEERSGEERANDPSASHEKREKNKRREESSGRIYWPPRLCNLMRRCSVATAS